MFCRQIPENKWKCTKQRRKHKAKNTFLEMCKGKKWRSPSSWDIWAETQPQERPRPTKEPTRRRRFWGRPTWVQAHLGCGRTPTTSARPHSLVTDAWRHARRFSVVSKNTSAKPSYIHYIRRARPTSTTHIIWSLTSHHLTCILFIVLVLVIWARQR
jgi:hypothetical protein